MNVFPAFLRDRIHTGRKEKCIPDLAVVNSLTFTFTHPAFSALNSSTVCVAWGLSAGLKYQIGSDAWEPLCVHLLHGQSVRAASQSLILQKLLSTARDNNCRHCLHSRRRKVVVTTSLLTTKCVFSIRVWKKNVFLRWNWDIGEVHWLENVAFQPEKMLNKMLVGASLNTEKSPLAATQELCL